jgi:hypothetical protein
MAWGGEAAHVEADLGDEHLRGSPADPTDLIQPVDRLGERGDLLVDLGLQRGDVGAGLVDPRQHGLQQEGVMVAEAATEGLLQLAALGAQAGARQLRQRLGSRSPAMSAASIARPETPKLSLATTESLLWRLQQPARRAAFRRCAPRPGRRGSGPGSRSRRIAGGGTKLGRSMPRSATLQSHTASDRSVLADPAGAYRHAR